MEAWLHVGRPGDTAQRRGTRAFISSREVCSPARRPQGSDEGPERRTNGTGELWKVPEGKDQVYAT